MKLLLIGLTLFASTSIFAADSRIVSQALDQVRLAQSSLRIAEQALVASLQEEPQEITCRIKTSLYTYEGTGANRRVAVSNAILACKKSGTIPSVCDNANIDVCF